MCNNLQGGESLRERLLFVVVLCRPNIQHWSYKLQNNVHREEPGNEATKDPQNNNAQLEKKSHYIFVQQYK